LVSLRVRGTATVCGRCTEHGAWLDGCGVLRYERLIIKLACDGGGFRSPSAAMTGIAREGVIRLLTREHRCVGVRSSCWYWKFLECWWSVKLKLC